MKEHISVEGNAISSDGVAVSIEQDGVSLVGNNIRGGVRGIYANASGTFIIGNAIEGGLQLGGKKPEFSPDDIVQAISQIPNEKLRIMLEKQVNDIVGKGERDDKTSAYERFVSILSNHATVLDYLSPFLPYLQRLVG